eukprot:TRINITY_DN4503_c0_g1_i15.p1 TRINITY_DN4503_c0_g1~~TRINITY_DN4503_c0_g1_i15.p1  ORF type:complete len:106 (-),score=2.38 TRINITY_DN4503_c0_g1_i15:408-725(-)
MLLAFVVLLLVRETMSCEVSGTVDGIDQIFFFERWEKTISVSAINVCASLHRFNEIGFIHAWKMELCCGLLQFCFWLCMHMFSYNVILVQEAKCKVSQTCRLRLI